MSKSSNTHFLAGADDAAFPLSVVVVVVVVVVAVVSDTPPRWESFWAGWRPLDETPLVFKLFKFWAAGLLWKGETETERERVLYYDMKEVTDQLIHARMLVMYYIQCL